MGGIPEQIEDGVTGFLVPPGDAGAMTDDVLRIRLGRNAAEDGQRRFGLSRQAEAYLGWYEKLMGRSERGKG